MQQDYPMTAQGAVLTDTRHKVLRNTYLMLALSLVPTAIGAGIGVNLEFGFLRASPIVSAIAVLAIFYGWIFAIERNKDSALGVGLLLGFTLFLGLLLDRCCRWPWA
jgi:modulator of FtsH protease